MPQTFGPYELLDLLGRGGMGEVYRARDTRRQRDVALKVLPEHLAADEKFAARFRRESLLAAQLNDPHIIPIHDFGEIDGRLFIDMRLVSGSDLASVLEQRGPLAAPVVVDVLTQVASALDSAHADGLMHRDVKPSNVMLTRLSDDLEGRRPFAYLVDFGIARSNQQMTALTETSSMAIGTVAYMSPERIAGEVGDGRADVYALACVLYEALTARPPFEGEAVSLIYHHLSTPPPRASAVSAEVPSSLDDVIATGMAKNTDDRYATAGDLADAAARALVGTPRAAPTGKRAAPRPSPLGRPAESVDPVAPPRDPTPPPARQYAPLPPPPVARGGSAVGDTRIGTAPWLAAASAPAPIPTPPITRDHPLAVRTLVSAASPEPVDWGDAGVVHRAELASFERPADGLAAARRLAAAGARVAVHAGVLVPYRDGWWGPDLEYVERLGSLARPGAMIVSAAGRSVLDEPDLVSLGRYPVPGFPTRRALFALTDDVTVALAPPRTTSVPARVPLLEREAELSVLTRAVGASSPLTTICGPPGTGRTLLAREAARRVESRFEFVHFVRLEPFVEIGDISAELARSIGVPELAGTETRPRLLAALRDQRVLLVLDGVAPGPDVGALLADIVGIGDVHVLAVAETPLGLAGEDVVRLDRLPAGVEPADPDVDGLPRLLLDLLPGYPAGFTVAGAEAAFGDLVLELPTLADRRLIRAADDGRFELPGTVRRAFGNEAGFDEAGSALAVDALIARSEDVARTWLTDEDAGWAALHEEVPNVLALLRWAHRHDVIRHARLARAAAWLLARAGLVVTAAAHLDAAAPAADPLERARHASALAAALGRADSVGEAADLWRSVGDSPLETAAETTAALASALYAGEQGDVLAAAAWLERVRELRRTAGESSDVTALVTLARARIESSAGRHTEAVALVQPVHDSVEPGSLADLRWARSAADVFRAADRPADALAAYVRALEAASHYPLGASAVALLGPVVASLVTLGRTDDAAAALALGEAVCADLAWPIPSELDPAVLNDADVSAARLTTARERARSYRVDEALARIVRLARGGTARSTR